MQLGIIGLGKMGGNMARRLRRAGIDVVGFNRHAATTEELANECGLIAAESPEALVERLDTPRLVWLMLPAGDVTESLVRKMRELLAPGDVLIDGESVYFGDDGALERAAAGEGNVANALVGLAIGFPLIGHATWHAYRDLLHSCRRRRPGRRS